MCLRSEVKKRRNSPSKCLWYGGDNIKITIVYDNELFLEHLTPDWGFSCFIEDDNSKVLFDTGANGRILLQNMERLRINPENIDVIVLSHTHRDHTGGLEALLQINPDVPVYRPSPFTKPVSLAEHFRTTGTLSWRGIEEQALIGRTGKGLIVITGCSHPGVQNILNFARRRGYIFGLVGGFHGFNKFNRLGDIRLIVPCHCTQHKKKIEHMFPDTYARCGVGRIFEIL